MTDSPEPYASVWQYLRDAALGFLIIIGGMLVAGAIAEPFRDITDLAYPVALLIGLAPFWWFTRRCQIHDFDFCDYIAISVLVISVSVVRDMLAGANPRIVDLIITVFAFGVFLPSWYWLRQKRNRSPAGH